MTLPSERYRAMVNIRSALMDLATHEGRIQKGDLRRVIYWALRHYPSEYELQEISEKCPRLLKCK